MSKPSPEQVIAILARHYPGERFALCLGSDEDFVGTNGEVWTTFPAPPWARVPETITDGGSVIRRLGTYMLHGYTAVCVRRGRYRIKVTVHILVAEAFLGPRPAGMEVCHFDGIRANCRLSNLRWDTHANNFADSLRHGTATIGEKNAMVKLSDDEARDVFRLRAQRLSCAEIGRRKGLCTQTVCEYLTGKRRRRIYEEMKHLVKGIRTPHMTRRGMASNIAKLTDADVRLIRVMRASGKKLNEIADIFGTTTSNVGLIIQRKTWAHIE